MNRDDWFVFAVNAEIKLGSPSHFTASQVVSDSFKEHFSRLKTDELLTNVPAPGFAKNIRLSISHTWDIEDGWLSDEPDPAEDQRVHREVDSRHDQSRHHHSRRGDYTGIVPEGIASRIRLHTLRWARGTENESHLTMIIDASKTRVASRRKTCQRVRQGPAAPRSRQGERASQKRLPFHRQGRLYCFELARELRLRRDSYDVRNILAGPQVTGRDHPAHKPVLPLQDHARG